MSVLLRFPETTHVSTLERALALLGLRLSQSVDRAPDGTRIYTAVEMLARQQRPDPTCSMCQMPAPVKVGTRYYCVSHWRKAQSEEWFTAI
jgi:hypothetical protein